MLSTPLICCSIGEATESASVFESAPGYVADTVTCTGVMLGYCATGSTSIATPPASADDDRDDRREDRPLDEEAREHAASRCYCATTDVDPPRLVGGAAAGDVDRRHEADAPRIDADATSSSRTASARRFASATLAARWPLASANPVMVIMVPMPITAAEALAHRA